MKMKHLKMIAVSMTAAAMCTALTGCGEEKADVSSRTESVSSSVDNSKQEEVTTTEEATLPSSKEQLTNQGLFDYEMLLNGEVLGVPIAESELLERGWTLLRSDEKSSAFEKNECTLTLWDLEEKDGDKIAYAIEFSDNFFDGDYSCSCVNEISLIDSSRDDVIAAFGEPNEVYGEYMIYYESPSTAMETESDTVKRANGCNNISFKANEKGVVFAVVMKCPEDKSQ